MGLRGRVPRAFLVRLSWHFDDVSCEDGRCNAVQGESHLSREGVDGEVRGGEEEEVGRGRKRGKTVLKEGTDGKLERKSSKTSISLSFGRTFSCRATDPSSIQSKLFINALWPALPEQPWFVKRGKRDVSSRPRQHFICPLGRPFQASDLLSFGLGNFRWGEISLRQKHSGIGRAKFSRGEG